MRDLLQPCKGGSYFLQLLPLDLTDAKRRLLGEGYEIVMDLDIMLIVKGGVESTLYPSGKVILKTLFEDEAVAEAERLGGILKN